MHNTFICKVDLRWTEHQVVTTAVQNLHFHLFAMVTVRGPPGVLDDIIEISLQNIPWSSNTQVQQNYITRYSPWCLHISLHTMDLVFPLVFIFFYEQQKPMQLLIARYRALLSTIHVFLLLTDVIYTNNAVLTRLYYLTLSASFLYPFFPSAEPNLLHAFKTTSVTSYMYWSAGIKGLCNTDSN